MINREKTPSLKKAGWDATGVERSYHFHRGLEGGEDGSPGLCTLGLGVERDKCPPPNPPNLSVRLEICSAEGQQVKHRNAKACGREGWLPR